MTKSKSTHRQFPKRIFWSFFYTKSEINVTRLTIEQYKADFIENRTKEDIEKSYKVAWNGRNRVIDIYWKRANYYWAFQVACFAGYFSFFSSKEYIQQPEILYFVTCLGIITSLAWILANIESRNSQHRWEKHIDILEDYVVGPLFKTIIRPQKRSITRIHEIASGFFIVIWFMLAIIYLSEHVTFFNRNSNLDYYILSCSVITILCGGIMSFGYGRRQFPVKELGLYKRKASI